MDLKTTKGYLYSVVILFIVPMVLAQAETSTPSTCQLERSSKEEQSAAGSYNGVIPQCADDGSYEVVQCHTATGFCWCASPVDGQPLRSTARRMPNMPECHNRSDSTRIVSFDTVTPTESKSKSVVTSLHETSPVNVVKNEQNSHDEASKRFRRQKKIKRKKFCHYTQRIPFNRNIQMVVRREYQKVMEKTGQEYDEHRVNRLALRWKYEQLDADGDLQLTKKELQHFRQLVRRVIRPRQCSRRLGRHCDLNGDDWLSKREWLLCFAVDDVTADHSDRWNSPVRRSHLRVRRSTSRRHQDKKRHQSSDKENSQTRTARRPRFHAVGPLTCDMYKESIESLMGNQQGQFVPVCDQNDTRKYARLQCDVRTNYCWCVNPETGQRIARSMSVDHMKPPDCYADDVKHQILSPTQSSARQIKRCSGTKKKAFYARLHSQINVAFTLRTPTPSVAHSSSNDGNSLTAAAEYKFDQLDVDGNKILSKSEWHPYRHNLSTWSGVKRCARNFMRFCDVDNNKIITLPEWVSCTVDNVEVISTEVRGRLNARNPLINVLNWD